MSYWYYPDGHFQLCTLVDAYIISYVALRISFYKNHSLNVPVRTLSPRADMKTSKLNYDHVSLVLLICILRYSTAISDDRHPEFLFDNHPEKRFSASPTNVTNITQMTTKVADKMDCVFSCTRKRWCRAINFKLQSDNDSLHVCELFSTSSLEKPENLKPAKGFVHLSMKCKDPSLCLNRGSCLPDDDNNYRCVCNGTKGTNCGIFYGNCSELLSEGSTTPGVYHIDPDGNGAFPVICEEGGWTVIQKNRKNSSISFTHGWQGYKTGFGNLTSEFWLGLEKIYRLTKRQVTSLRVDLEDLNGNKKHAVYSSFSIADESDFYRLQVSGYSGTAGDAITTASNQEWINNNMRFSTPDKDNDGYPGGSCAVGRNAGWWYRWCTNSDLNGGKTWWTFNQILKSTKMKIK